MPFAFLLALPAFAQPSIPGGSCNSSTLQGTYELVLNGRQVTVAGAISKIFQSVGTATFDGQSKVTFTLTANQVNITQSFGTPLVYSGTYSLQANCQGTVNINTGDTASFTLIAFNQSKTFALIGSDATYAFSGSGNLQPTTACQVSSLSGVHEFSAQGNGLSNATVNGVVDVAGVLTFDGAGNLTGKWTVSSNSSSSTVNATGSYTVTSNCLGSATITDSSNNMYAVSFSIYSAAPDFAVAFASPLVVFSGSGAAAQTTNTTNKVCSAASLNGTYELTLNGRQISNAGTISKILASVGTAKFDGASQVTFTLTANTNTAPGTALVYSGGYAVNADCTGSVAIVTGDTANFSLVAFSVNGNTLVANNFVLVGSDATYAFTGSGAVQPAACSIATLSGPWPFSATGNGLSGNSVTSVSDFAGLLTFDGQGNVNGTWVSASNAANTNVTATGTYTVNPNCTATANLSDSTGAKYGFSLSVTGAAAGNFTFTASTPLAIFQGAGHTAVVNPGQALVNAASFNPGETPAGSVFSLFGSGFGTTTGQPTQIPLPTSFLNPAVSVTINGEAAPLFYVSPTQINAQMPEDIPPGLATVIVKVGNASSNAAAVTIPAAATPGIIVYGNNRAVAVNASQQRNPVVATDNPAKVGDTLVAYFTGGGAVNGSGLVTGSPTPGSLFPVSATSSVTVAGREAKVSYIGLTPGSIGLYQANFLVPTVAAGDRALVINIGGKNSNAPLLAIGN